MLSSICDWKPGKCTFSVPENVFPSPENAGEARESCMRVAYAHPRFLRCFPVPSSRFPVWIYSPQVNISRVPRLTFFLSDFTTCERQTFEVIFGRYGHKMMLHAYYSKQKSSACCSESIYTYSFLLNIYVPFVAIVQNLAFFFRSASE